MYDTFPLLIGGLVLFLYAITQLSDTMSRVFTEKAKEIISKYIQNLFSAIMIGTILTILLDSSSAVIIITIVFINSKTLDFRQAMGIVMGANIGTTISSQIIALNISKYAILPLLIGLALIIFIKNEKIKNYGKGMLYFGMLFFGLYIMESSVLHLKSSTVFEHWVSQIGQDYLLGTFIGGVITIIIQSSSATVGIAIVLGKQQLLSVAGGIAIMLGAELGTCFDTLLATIKGSKQAIKTGLFHLVFNLTTILVGLIVFEPFVQLISTISKDQSIGSQIANAHVLFNIAGVLLFLPFVKLTEKLFNKLLPDKVQTIQV